MNQVPTIDDTGSKDDVSYLARQASTKVLEGMAESVTSANPALETTTFTHHVWLSGESTEKLYEAGTAGINPDIDGIANLRLDSAMETGLSGNQYRNVHPPVHYSDDSEEPDDADEHEDQKTGNDSEEPSNYKRMKGSIDDIIRNDPDVLSAALDAHAEFHAHEMEQLRRQATDKIGKIEESLAKHNIPEI